MNDSSVCLLFVDTIDKGNHFCDCLTLSSGYCDSFSVCLHMNRFSLYDIYHILGEKWLMGNITLYKTQMLIL